MRRLRWLGVVAALALVGWFLVLPQVQKKALREQCARDGGTLDPSGTTCHLPR